MPDPSPTVTHLEERLTHLQRAHDELSDVVASQGRQIDRLTRSLQLLAERDAERQAGAEAAPAHERPPHY
jgi:SlyX protein